jgi:hypothetical protein
VGRRAATRPVAARKCRTDTWPTAPIQNRCCSSVKESQRKSLVSQRMCAMQPCMTIDVISVKPDRNRCRLQYRGNVAQPLTGGDDGRLCRECGEGPRRESRVDDVAPVTISAAATVERR